MPRRSPCTPADCRADSRCPPVTIISGLVGLDRVAPAYAERAVRVLEPGSAQFLKWLPVVFVPALVRWIRSPLAYLAGSSDSLSGVVVEAAKVAATHRTDGWCGCATPPRGAAAANVTKLLLAVAGGWLAHIGSAAAVVTAVSPKPSPSSPMSPSATPDATSAAVATATTPPPGTTLAADFFGPRLVRWLGIATVSGAASFPLCELGSGARNAFSPYVGKAFLRALDVPMDVLAVLLGLGIFASTGLATLFGFAAGHVSASPGGAFDPSGSGAPWKVALLPLATSVAATVLSAGSVGSFFDGGFSWMRDVYVADAG